MSLADAPAVLILAGLTAYTVFAGADFGAGFWQLLGGESPRAEDARDHARRSMGPVWEANHVWLIFVLVVCWTAYPTAFASIASTLCVPLFLAAVGIILRGTAYALRTDVTAPGRATRPLELTFSLSSILTPFALGAVVGAIASGRVPVGNARGDLATSWLNPTSALIGSLGVAVSAYLAAVYLAGDARRLRRPALAAAYRKRALATGVVAGAIALGGLPVLRFDARPIWDGLTTGAGVGALLASAATGVATLALVARGRYEPARVSAALAVAAIVVGWALAQRPRLLTGLTIEQAAAPRSTLIAILVGAAIAAVLILPSLALLFGLFLRGTFDPAPHPMNRAADRSLRAETPRLDRLAATAVGCLIAGIALGVFADSWLLAVGILALFGFVLSGFVAIALGLAEAPGNVNVDR
jgi:cytochrome d ubiquinol oxidase subunit II